MAEHALPNKFKLNGHQGYTVYNESTRRMELCCDTCTWPVGGALLLDSWSPRQRDAKPLVWKRHADPLNHPVAGQWYRWEGLTYVVTRVSEKGRWAYIRVPGDDGWSKRQPLPLPAGSVLVEVGA